LKNHLFYFYNLRRVYNLKIFAKSSKARVSALAKEPVSQWGKMTRGRPEAGMHEEASAVEEDGRATAS